MEENQENQENQTEKEMTLEDAFNMLVQLARNTKLNYQEHAIVDKAVQMVHSALEGKPDND
jgi:predicted amidohydrolase YtcJ